MSVMRIKDAQGNWQEVAALHGLPGTSVSITSISQSTEDDGYSVVTFSDGKQLKVKNGSKGSAGEGGAGGGSGCECKKIVGEAEGDLTFDMPIEEMVALGVEGLIKYEMYLVAHGSKHYFRSMHESDTTLTIYFTNVDNTWVSEYQVAINKTTYKITYDQRNKTITEIPQPSPTRDEGKTLVVEDGKYVLKESTNSNPPPIYVAEVDGVLASEGITPEALTTEYGEVFHSLKMLVINESTLEAKVYNFANFSMGEMAIDFTNGTDKMVHMAADGSLSYKTIATNELVAAVIAKLPKYGGETA